MNSEKLTIYQPDKQLKMGAKAVWKEMIFELIQNRELIWCLFLRDFRAKYKQSLLGFAWVIINPLIAVGVFVFLQHSGVLHISPPGVPYVAYALMGLTIWQVFSGGLTACAGSIIGAGAMVGKINFPKKCLVIASMGQAIVELGVRLILTGLVFLVFRFVPSWKIIFLPFTLLPMILFTLSVGLFVALLAGLFRDMINIVTLATTFLMFLVPVLYPSPTAGLYHMFDRINPLSHFITGPRDMVLYGKFTSPEGFWCSCVISVIIFLLAWRVFHLVETKLPERI